MVQAKLNLLSLSPLLSLSLSNSINHHPRRSLASPTRLAPLLMVLRHAVEPVVAVDHHQPPGVLGHEPGQPLGALRGEQLGAALVDRRRRRPLPGVAPGQAPLEDHRAKVVGAAREVAGGDRRRTCAG